MQSSSVTVVAHDYFKSKILVFELFGEKKGEISKLSTPMRSKMGFQPVTVT